MGFQKRIWRTSTTFFTNVLEKHYQKVFYKSPPKKPSQRVDILSLYDNPDKMGFQNGLQKGITTRTMRTSTTFFTNVLEKHYQKVFYKSPPKKPSQRVDILSLYDNPDKMGFQNGLQKGITTRTMRTSTTFFIDVLEKPFQKVFHKSPPKNHHKGLIYYPFMTTPTKGTPTRTISKNHTQYRISYSIIIILLISTYLFSSFPVGNRRFPTMEVVRIYAKKKC